MNFIEQLQQSPKWKEFEEWYNEYINKVNEEYEVGYICCFGEIEEDNKTNSWLGFPYEVNFCFIPLEFQKGVFEKFIESRDGTIETHYNNDDYVYWIWTEEGYSDFSSFEELLIWYFNN